MLDSATSSAGPILVTVTSTGVMTVTLNRPASRNALSADMAAGLSAAFGRADSDDDVRVVVITGAGDAFCAGADFSRGAEVFDQPSHDTFTACPISPTAWQIRKPVIAAVNGHAIGIGLTIVLHCDIRVMARGAKYSVVQVRRGVMPDAFSHWTLPRIAGMGVATDILLTGRTFDGDEAFRLGIASRVVDSADVLSAAMSMADDIAVNANPLSVAVSKRLLWSSFESTAGRVGDEETRLHHVLMGSADSREGVESFLERRTPHWKSRVPRDWPAEGSSP